MARAVSTLVATFLLAALLVVGTPSQIAQASQMPGCMSSIDPKCAGANLPILVEAGIVSGGGATAAAPAVVAGGSAAISPIVLGGAVGSVFIGIGTHLYGVWSTATAIMGGVVGQELQTNPDYTPTVESHCDIRSTVAASALTLNYCPSIGLWNDAGTKSWQLATTASYSPPNSAGNIVQGTLSLGGTFVWTGTATTPITSASLTAMCQNLATSAIRAVQLLSTASRSATLFTTTVNYPVTCTSAERLTGFALGNRVQSASGSSFINAHNPLYDVPDAGIISGVLRATVRCATPGGTPHDIQVDKTFSIPAGDNLPIPDAKCPSGQTVLGWSVGWLAPGATTWVEVVPWTNTPEYIADLPSEYPDCFTGTPCQLQLWKVGAGGALDYCGSEGQLCSGWAQSPNANDQYQCRYGGYTIALDYCSAFRDPTVGILPNTNADGTLIPITAPVPTQLPNPVRDPVTNAPLPTLPTDLSPDLSAGEGVSAQDCFPSGWGVLNPFSWVVLPVQCAMRWAFVPRESVVITQQTVLEDAMQNSFFGETEQLVTSLTTPFYIGSTGCNGPAFTVQMNQFDGPGMNQVYYPLSACDEPMRGFAGFFRILSQGFVLIGAGLAGVRYIAGIVGFVGAGDRVAESGSGVKFR
jgi:hypothetical protein